MAMANLDLLILKTLDLEPLHGYGIGQRIEQMSGGVFRLTLGGLYPALQRLERSGLVRRSGPRPTTIGARATTRSRRPGAAASARSRRRGTRTAEAMLRILGTTPKTQRG